MHKDPAVRRLLRQFPRLALEWLPHYAPDLNPVEALWSHLKYGHNANLIPRDLDQFDDEMTDFLVATKVCTKLLQAYWRQTPLGDGLRKRAA